MIARVNRGLYLVPTKLPPGGVWTPSEFLALNALMTSIDAPWQITNKAAFQRYEWEEQIPNRSDVCNYRVSGLRKIGTSVFRLIKTTIRYGNTGTIRRIGAILQSENVSDYKL